MITETSGLNGDDVLQAALCAIDTSGLSVRASFADEFTKRFIKKFSSSDKSGG